MKTKNLRTVLVTFCALGLMAATVVSCKKSDKAPEMNISAITANGVDLNGTSSATGVDPGATITITFTDDVAPATATNANVTLTNTLTNTAVPMNISATGATITAKPTSILGTGTQYSLSIANVTSQENVAVGSTTRTFTTAGSFAPEGAVAYWNFDNGNGTDVIGGFNATTSTDVSYVTGRNAAAGKAASFNGTSSIMVVPNATSLMNTGSFTLAFWCNVDTVNHVDSLGNPKNYFVMGIGIYNGFQFEIDGNGKDANGNKNAAIGTCKMAASYNDVSSINAQDLWADCSGNLGFSGWTYSKDLSGSGGLEAILGNQWANVVCVYDSTSKIGSLYVNGVLLKTQDFNLYTGQPLLNCVGLEFNAASGAGTGLAFGFAEDLSNKVGDGNSWGTINSTGSNHYQGQLDDVRIYHKPLTQADVTAMYNSGK